MGLFKKTPAEPAQPFNPFGPAANFATGAPTPTATPAITPENTPETAATEPANSLNLPENEPAETAGLEQPIAVTAPVATEPPVATPTVFDESAAAAVAAIPEAPAPLVEAPVAPSPELTDELPLEDVNIPPTPQEPHLEAVTPEPVAPETEATPSELAPETATTLNETTPAAEENPEPLAAPEGPTIDDVIAQQKAEAAAQPTVSIFAKQNLLVLVIIGVAIVGLTALSFVMYVKWQGEKTDALNKSGEINSLSQRLEDQDVNSDEQAQAQRDYAELKEENTVLNGDKVKLEENVKTLTEQNKKLQTENDELKTKNSTLEKELEAAKKK